MKLKINRKTWLRGEGGGNSYLYRKLDGKKCCLGFYCLAKKIRVKDIKDIGSPDDKDLENHWNKLSDLVNDDGSYHCAATDVCEELMMVNDNEKITDKTRESKITKLFKKIGVEVKFYN